MPFGLRNAGKSFQRFMERVLAGLDYCFIYVNDVLIGSKSLEEHEQHLREVLGRTEEQGIVRNGEKCMLGVPKVQFLGHMVSACGILGMVNFYRRFIKGAAGVLKPLTDALREASGKAAKLERSAPMLEAFEGSKQQMVKAIHLAHRGKKARLALSVDTSGTHVGSRYVVEYTSDIRHVAGKENVLTDCLSRPPDELSLPRSTHVASEKVPSGRWLPLWHGMGV